MRRPLFILLAALALVAPGLLEAQSIVGTVRDQATGNPVEAAQVFVEGLELGALTQSNGNYTILNVPTGTHTLTVQSLGYRTESVEVTVAAGEAVVHNFFVSQQALQLDEVVVTGTASASRVREIGNSVAVLDAAVAEVQPISNVSDLLRGRLAGVVVQQGSGDAGTASTIKIRGSSTMRLVNDGPLVYIDGVRVSNRMQSGQRDVSRIDDLDPTMIESMEVIKGPAAATLYGTEAANGVINITHEARSVWAKPSGISPCGKARSGSGIRPAVRRRTTRGGPERRDQGVQRLPGSSRRARRHAPYRPRPVLCAGRLGWNGSVPVLRVRFRFVVTRA